MIWCSCGGRIIGKLLKDKPLLKLMALIISGGRFIGAWAQIMGFSATCTCCTQGLEKILEHLFIDCKFARGCGTQGLFNP
jgi:hypothetical protein